MNPIVNLLNAIGSWFDDIARWIRNGRSSDALLDETIDSMRNAFGQSYEAAKSASGQIEISLNSLAEAKSASRTAHANVTRAVRDAKNMTGQELAIQQAKIVRLQQLATHTDEVVATMEATIKKAQQTQQLVEGKVAMEATNMKLRETVLRTNVAMEKLFGTMEQISDSQLRAAGMLSGQRVKDHSDVLSRRASSAKGRSESSQRMAEQMVGNPFETELTDEEKGTLRAAYEAAGATFPTEDAAAAEKSAS